MSKHPTSPPALFVMPLALPAGVEAADENPAATEAPHALTANRRQASIETRQHRRIRFRRVR